MRVSLTVTVVVETHTKECTDVIENESLSYYLNEYIT